jgi:polysaccharide pyruvyl transferase WcaK-like protein
MMRILIDPGTYNLRNVGDATMLQTAILRLSALFPNASIQVFTEDPEGLAAYTPAATPLSTGGRSAWLADGFLFERFYKPIDHGRIAGYLKALERKFRCRWPWLAKYFIQKRRRVPRETLSEYLGAVSKADLFVVPGMGGITDAFLRNALRILDSLDLAIQHRVPTAMFGQGIGPIEIPELMARAREVLPKVNLISLREGRAGLPLLELLGVPCESIMVAGDDAIEFAFQSRNRHFGSGLGVNLRAAKYSQVEQALIECVRPILRDFARANQAPLVPVPISWVPGEEDWITVQQLLVGFDDLCDFDGDDKQSIVINQIRRCRVVITGSYHAAVFALAQGIPAVGLARTQYYLDKFLGLSEHFGVGCQVVSLSDAQMPAKLQEAIDRLWNSAEEMRPELLDAAASQIESSRAAYRQVQKLLLSSL